MTATYIEQSIYPPETFTYYWQSMDRSNISATVSTETLLREIDYAIMSGTLIHVCA